VETDDEVELGKIFRPLRLAAVQEFCRGKVFEILVIGDDINGGHGTFEVVTPDLEGFVDSKQFLIVDVVIQFRGGEGSGVECHGMELAVFGLN